MPSFSATFSSLIYSHPVFFHSAFPVCFMGQLIFFFISEKKRVELDFRKHNKDYHSLIERLDKNVNGSIN